MRSARSQDLCQWFTHLIFDSSGPEYDLSSMRNLIAWRDRHRSEHAG
jgi:hypothetical protein